VSRFRWWRRLRGGRWWLCQGWHPVYWRERWVHARPPRSVFVLMIEDYG
jgi:hypothetical protein